MRPWATRRVLPLRRGAPGRPPRGGKPATDTERQRIFEEAVWAMALDRDDPRIPARFEPDGVGRARLDQGCIDMASDWLDHARSRDGRPVGLRIRDDAWHRGRRQGQDGRMFRPQPMPAPPLPQGAGSA